MDDMRLKTKKVYDAVEGVLENNACHLHKPPAQLPLRIQVMSDLHLESRHEGLPVIERAAPVLALLGDIGYASEGEEGEKLRQFLLAQTEAFDHVILVAGNHEYYGTSEEDGVAWLRALCEEVPRNNLHFLDRDEMELQGVRILGCTMWTRIPKRFRLDAWSMMRDFDKIGELSREEERGQGGDEELAVMRAVHHGCEKYHEWYLRDSLWLAGAIERARVDTANNTCNGAIVLTHHAPLTKPEVVHPDMWQPPPLAPCTQVFNQETIPGCSARVVS